jgi:hypothetical protein
MRSKVENSALRAFPGRRLLLKGAPPPASYRARLFVPSIFEYLWAVTSITLL